MIHKYTSIKRVISKVLTDLDLKEGDHRITDMLEWSSEAIEKIGAFPYFVVKVTGREGEPVLSLNDYQVKLPMGAYKVLQVSYAESSLGPFYPMRYGTGTFDYAPLKTNDTTDSTTTVFSTTDLVSVAMDLYNLSYEDALAKLNNEPDTKSLISALLSKDSTARNLTGGGEVQPTTYTYVISGGYIKCNQRVGYLMVAYQSIPLDTDGYPLIPDEQSFIEALYWYVTMKMLYPEWKEGRIRDAVYYEAKRSWNYYSKQAYGNALMPNYDEMETIKNAWIRLIPDLDAHNTFYTRMGEHEKYYNQDNPRYNSYYEKVFYK